MLTELIELGQKNEKKMNERYPKWNKAKYSGNQQWQEGNQDSKEWFGTKGKINIYPDQNEVTRIQKSEEALTNHWDNMKRSNIQILAVPGEEQQQEIENLFEQIMKENFPNLAKEIVSQEVQEAQRVPRKLHPKRNTRRHNIIRLPKIKDKERILKAARENERVIYKGVPIRLSAYFSKETLQARRGRQEGNLKSWKVRTYNQDYSIQQSYHLE